MYVMDDDQRELLEAARREFPRFYEIALTEEKMVLDGLVLAHAALVVGINAPRGDLEPQLRAAVERATNHAEHVFTSTIGFQYAKGDDHWRVITR
jgi:hypothetical protein